MTDVRNPQQFERLYHGTNDIRAESIMREGLNPERMETGRSQQVVHATMDPRTAWSYASERVHYHGEGGKARVIAFDWPTGTGTPGFPDRMIAEHIPPEKLTLHDRFSLNKEIDERKKKR